MSSFHKQTDTFISKTKSQALIDTGAEVNILLESKVPSPLYEGDFRNINNFVAIWE